MGHVIDLMPRLRPRPQREAPTDAAQPSPAAGAAFASLPDLSNVTTLLADAELRRLQLLECCGCR